MSPPHNGEWTLQPNSIQTVLQSFAKFYLFLVWSFYGKEPYPVFPKGQGAYVPLKGLVAFGFNDSKQFVYALYINRNMVYSPNLHRGIPTLPCLYHEVTQLQKGHLLAVIDGCIGEGNVLSCQCCLLEFQCAGHRYNNLLS